MTLTNLASGLLTGAALACVVAVLLGLREGRRYSPSSPERGDRLSRGAAALVAASRRPAVWTALFLLLSLAVGAGVVLALAGGPMSPLAGALAVASAVLALCAFLVVGVYRTVRFRGRTSAEAFAVSAWAVGALFVLAVSGLLLLGG
ncbi:hypothetical protein [Halomarina ordinaria]|uniref:Uncharacterized protein n=1 Tax=Halomarina ordinaria TaxID=3033939 RepID=A0ABD5U8B0_9EURY|nr:hypothetical protein [Halomarina sp. PSRA2]